MMLGGEGLPTEIGFCNVVRDFEYSINQKELRIQDIFVKYFNSEYSKGVQDHFNAEKKSKFASKLIEKLQQIRELSPNENFVDRDTNIEELVKAFKNLVMYMDLAIDRDDFSRYFETLCDLIKLDDSL
jgi:histidyl-tRNA synthetase